MLDEDGLFPDPRPIHQPVAHGPEALPDWQIASLREALDKRGLVTMSERQSAVESYVGRPVASLRDLTFAEARRVAEALATESRPLGNQGSSWDSRDGDTWIDRL